MSDQATNYQEFRRGWPVVFSAMLGIGLGLSPLPFYTLGSFAPELAREFGWSFGSIMAGVPFLTGTVILFSPVIGWLADRYGVRIVTVTSVALFGLSFMAFALSNGSLPQFYATWAIMAACGTGTLPITWTRAVNGWFDLRKGLALGLSLMGTGLFGYLAKPLVAWIISDYGWRTAYVVIGALPLAIALPVALICFFDVGPAKQSVADRQAQRAARKESTPGLNVKEVLTSWRYWVIALACGMIAFAVGGAIPNMENILRLAGFSRSEIVSQASLIGIAVLVGRLASGWLMDRYWAPGVALLSLCIPSAGYWLLAHPTSSYGLSAASVFGVGFAAGVEFDLMAFLIARYFGLKSYTTIYAGIYGAFALGSAIGPVVFGRTFDADRNYLFPLTLSSGFLLLSAILLLSLGRYRNFAVSQPEPSPLNQSVTNPA